MFPCLRGIPVPPDSHEATKARSLTKILCGIPALPGIFLNIILWEIRKCDEKI
ncbi:Uncharacterized protein dnm_060180 [Desulfonema magnum]|uniref:Uncharacterized protein n=1 Tax=Desulfonema magnum TaxID=45655 RepID=A0A975BQE9_9BACT|nr:Uncharacterized protein dnm_060180 [Desulfonema magnum]